ncbi:UDP-2,3-diacylglucosamine hydrolase [Larkinella arboricola]|uniref:UDP-2,3-diacylglucosamine hydrolase n=1 Tax=Larkinella arboricola TaxID=643671 RepID=A0A327WU41_LARAB|nr:UDP-2,3-diacylglucosamine diphosphatase [Larkinella arboricola]RAJ96043.1 UDP-2,3-diacylglucosamine hydrolase [Larkinella arboricola]
MFPIEPIALPPGQAVYFASDFHLGIPSPVASRERERRVIRWLTNAQTDAAAIFLVGDVFDFWFEYRNVIPKGFSRLQGKLAELADSGLKIVLFTGNHDMWMANYFAEEMGIPTYRRPKSYEIGGKRFLVGHGDGLGPGDFKYKQLKKLFENGMARWFFRWLHPDIGMDFGNGWSRKRKESEQHRTEEFKGDEQEWLWQYCREVETRQHHDYYIFGHRHLALDLNVTENSRYINLGEWINLNTYARFDGQDTKLLTFEG